MNGARLLPIRRKPAIANVARHVRAAKRSEDHALHCFEDRSPRAALLCATNAGWAWADAVAALLTAVRS